jgi:hypothetical protein
MIRELLIAGGLVFGLFAMLVIGERFGRRISKKRSASEGAQVGAIQGAMLGLLGLLLGFSFAGAAGRFMERQDLIVDEANAIGTAYLRAELLDEPERNLLRAELAAYVSHRLSVSDRAEYAVTRADFDQIAGHHGAMWRITREGVERKPGVMIALLGPINEVIDLHSTRVAAGRKHLPALVMSLLLACSGLAIGVIGYGCGVSGKGSMVMATALCVLMAAALWATIDLDHPRAGMIRLSDRPLRELALDAHLAPDPAAARGGTERVE